MTGKSHIYRSGLAGKITWFIRRFGAKEMVMKPLRRVLAPFVMPLLEKSTFDYRGLRLPLTYHRYAATWSSERAVEITIAGEYLDRFAGKSVLELGNVTPHYFDVGHLILDKYETGSDSVPVINEDVVEFDTDRRFDLVISISTIEHIGFDDDGDSRQKIPLAISKCRSLLTPGGLFLLTVPLGYNPVLDELVATDELGCDRAAYIRREGPLKWAQCARNDALRCEYGRPFPYANCIMVAEFDEPYRVEPTTGAA